MGLDEYLTRLRSNVNRCFRNSLFLSLLSVHAVIQRAGRNSVFSVLLPLFKSAFFQQSRGYPFGCRISGGQRSHLTWSQFTVSVHLSLVSLSLLSGQPALISI